MRLAFSLGITAFFILVQGCSTAGPAPTDDPNSGEENPEDPAAEGEGSADPNAEKGGDKTKTPGTTPTTPDPNTPPPAPTTPPEPPPKPKSTMTFFVTSTGTGALGGNIGGLAGADKKCQDAAIAVTGGDHTWHAYLSITGTNAKDRVGVGPWTNQKGKVIAKDVATLHNYINDLPNADLVDEKGADVPKLKSAILTGSKQDGTPALQNCQNWTSAAANQNGRYGDAASNSSPVLGVRWNDATKNSNCTQAGIAAVNGEGRLYCFAID